MILSSILLVAGLAAASAQEAASDTSGEGWVPVDGVSTVVNEEIVTESELTREANRIRESNAITISTLDDLRKFESDVRTQVVLRRLQSQAGKSLGLEEEQVDRLVDSRLDGIRKRVGVLTYVRDLEERGLAADEVREETRRNFYGRTWMDDTVGDDKSGKRPHRDRFVRPGELYQLYQGVREQFGAPEMASMEQFTMTGGPNQDPVAIMAEAESMRERALAGEDLEVLVREVGPERSTTVPIEVPVSRQVDERLEKFATSAAPGEVSPILTERNERYDRTEYTFFRMVGRKAAVAPRPFLDGEVQSVLEQRALEQRDRWYLALGHRQLIDGSYIRPPLEIQETEP